MPINILQAILAGLPLAEQIALLFIHSADSQHKYTVVTGAVNDVAPIVGGIVASIAAAIHPPAAGTLYTAPATPAA